MNDDHNPAFADDDDFLPRRDAPVGKCWSCGSVHRLDLGCTAITASSSRFDCSLQVGQKLYFNAPPSWRDVWQLVKQRVRWMLQNRRWFPKPYVISKVDSNTVTYR